MDPNGYLCQLCGATLKTKANLKQHMNKHDRHIEYKCGRPGCNKSFCNRGSEFNHRMNPNVHRELPRTSTSDELHPGCATVVAFDAAAAQNHKHSIRNLEFDESVATTSHPARLQELVGTPTVPNAETSMPHVYQRRVYRDDNAYAEDYSGELTPTKDMEPKSTFAQRQNWQQQYYQPDETWSLAANHVRSDCIDPRLLGSRQQRADISRPREPQDPNYEHGH